jgi:Ser/Thr protein kinase RdoA (MazF antagonist)
LRVSHSLRRSPELIAGEADWINYLADWGVPVARALESRSGRLVEAVEDGQGGQFLATAFVKASGKSPWAVGWSSALYERYGQLIGSMHARTKQYRPADPAWKRPEWDDSLFNFVGSFLPESEQVAKEKYRALCAHLHRLPKDTDSYGLIHQDAHGSNMLISDSGTITLIDFDDCAYSWFINDIAIVLFYMTAGEDDPAAVTGEFMPPFLRGYRQANQLDPRWLKEIPGFLKLRELELYAVVHRDFDVNHIDHRWVGRFMHERKQRIEQDAPFIDFDFEALEL